MPWLSLSFVTGVFVWLPPGGKETHRDSGNLPHANIYITCSPAFVAQGRGWLLRGGGGGFDGIRPCKKPVVLWWSWRASPISLTSLGCGCSSEYIWPLPTWEQCWIVPWTSWQLSPVLACTLGRTGPLTEMFFDSAQGRSPFRSDSFAPYDQEMVPINLG